ncbi:DUF2637 domain-containing protein [Streptomyces violascens]|uniref:DUF2637 domain-containing protein n=1 Tax=Streptomyces violascens TaxID=67381 RepID=A0ABQ3QPX8_9ACTN|nr:DUF2637 domain-containing protein [Streptomyces violascens]GGU24063.1 hypothetical protein GCM10010289_52040 [Streptomyces violascens]GHI39326.1 hypothetical protein Sviol_37340 [Streptomyces violascens]
MKRTPKTLLVLALVVVVGMAFRVSWNALRDVARAIGADHTAATLYPFVVDGLMALALVATLVLTADARRFALRVLGTYTGASLVLNYVHGLVPALHGASVDWGRLADWNPANWALVLLATSLPVGSIYFGSDLVAKVLHHQPTPAANAEKTVESVSNRSMADQGEPTPEPRVVNAVPIPRPVQVGFLKPTLPLKPMPAIEPVPARPASTVAADSVRTRRATGRVPDVARSTRPKRTPGELLQEARAASADWPDAHLTADRIRKTVHTSAEKARGLRDALIAERAA